MTPLRDTLSDRTNWLRNAVLARRRVRRHQANEAEARRDGDDLRANMARLQGLSAAESMRECLARAAIIGRD